MKFTRQGKRIYDNAIQETYDPKGEKHFWIGGGTPYWEHGEDTDINAVQKGYVSITPIHLDLTNYSAGVFAENLVPSTQASMKFKYAMQDTGCRGQDTGFRIKKSCIMYRSPCIMNHVS